MIFKVIILALLFFILRNFVRGYLAYQSVKDGFTENQKQQYRSKSKKDDAIDAEYTVVDE